MKSDLFGTLDLDTIENITQGVAPGFAYNAQGHIILQNDNQIEHGFNHNRNIVHSILPSGSRNATVEVSQMNFQKEAQSLAASHNIPQTTGGMDFHQEAKTVAAAS